jgi:hypothetical protein
MPLVLLWPSKDDYYGIGQSEALHFIQSQKSQYFSVFAYISLLTRKYKYTSQLLVSSTGFISCTQIGNIYANVI